jgi:hypothetical protein
MLRDILLKQLILPCDCRPFATDLKRAGKDKKPTIPAIQLKTCFFGQKSMHTKAHAAGKEPPFAMARICALTTFPS